jgi:hypothetical protein
VRGVDVAMQRETQRARQLEFLQLTANPIDMQIIGPKGRAQVLREVATEIGLPGENIVPTDDQMEQQQKQAQAAAQMQAMVGHAQGPQQGGGPPGGGPPGGGGGGGPSPAPSGPPPGMSGDQGPRTNLVNPNAGGGPPIRGGPQ